jgi:hypothetical protein
MVYTSNLPGGATTTRSPLSFFYNVGRYVSSPLPSPGGNLNLDGNRVVVYNSVSPQGNGFSASITGGTVRLTNVGGQTNFGRGPDATGRSTLYTSSGAVDGAGWSGAITGTYTWFTVPSIPTALNPSRSGTSVSLATGGSSDNGASNISSYTTQWSQNGGGFTATATHGGPHTYTGLARGSSYVFRVWANNGAGASQARQSGSVYIFNLPPTPGAPILSRASDGSSITITSGAVTADGGVTDYNWRSSTDGYTWGGWNSMGTDRVATSGATPTQFYYIQTRAVSAEGVGAESAASFTPGVPTAPQSITIASQVGTSITINIVGSSNNGGSGITSFTAQRSENDGAYTGNQDISSGSTVFSGLTPGSNYRFRAFATNATGNSLSIETNSTLVAAYGTLRKGTDFVPITIGRVYRQGAWRNITNAKVYRGGAWRNITNV